MAEAEHWSMRWLRRVLPWVFGAFLLVPPIVIATFSVPYALLALAFAALLLGYATYLARATRSSPGSLVSNLRRGTAIAFAFTYAWLWGATLPLLNWGYLLMFPLVFAILGLALVPKRRWLQFVLVVPLFLVGFVIGLGVHVSWTAAIGVQAAGPASGPGPSPPADGYPATDLPDPELARGYRPLYFFRSSTHWIPTRVEAYLDAETTKLVEGERTVARAPLSTMLESYRQRCARPGSSCVITLSCPNRDVTCAHSSRTDNRQTTVYAVVTRNPWASEPGIARPSSGLLSELEVLVTYWAFYRYDEWSSNFIRQWHEGDWEAVVVGLGSRKPLFVGYSAHCDGSWREWRDGQVDAFAAPNDPITKPRTFPDQAGTHVGVYVALGSHANYPADHERPPAWTRCEGLDPTAPRTRGLIALTAGSQAREEFWRVDDTSQPLVVYPEVRRGAQPPLTFPARWGADDRISFLDVEIGEPGKGPNSPSRNPIWTNPLRTIFCDWEATEWCPSK